MVNDSRDLFLNQNIKTLHGLQDQNLIRSIWRLNLRKTLWEFIMNLLSPISWWSFICGPWPWVFSYATNKTLEHTFVRDWVENLELSYRKDPFHIGCSIVQLPILFQIRNFLSPHMVLHYIHLNKNSQYIAFHFIASLWLHCIHN